MKDKNSLKLLYCYAGKLKLLQRYIFNFQSRMKLKDVRSV